MPKPQQRQPCLLDSLPNELLPLICSWLTTRSIRKFAQVDKFRYSILNPELYRANVQRQQGNALHCAAFKGSVGTLRHSLAAGADVNMITLLPAKLYERHPELRNNQTYYNITHIPLCLATFYDHVEIVELLLDSGARLNAGEEPMPFTLAHIPTSAPFIAAKQDNLEMLKILMAAKDADVNVKDDRGNGLLWYAMEGKVLAMHKYLVEQLRDPENNAPDVMPILHIAVSSKRRELIQLLLDSGKFDINKRDSQGNTPLFYAARTNHVGTLQLLLDRQDVDPTAINYEGVDIVAATLLEKSPACAMVLLKHPQITFDPWDTFQTACHMEMEEAATYLITSDDVPITPCPRTGRSWMHVAAHRGFKPAITALYEKQPTLLNYLSRDGSTPLLEALGRREKDAAEALLTLKADVTPVDSDNRTALHVACAMQMAKHVDRIINLGADVNAKDYDGNTPLHIACRNGNLDIIRSLLEADASITETNAEGRMPLHEVGRHKWQKIPDSRV